MAHICFLSNNIRCYMSIQHLARCRHKCSHSNWILGRTQLLLGNLSMPTQFVKQVMIREDKRLRCLTSWINIILQIQHFSSFPKTKTKHSIIVEKAKINVAEIYFPLLKYSYRFEIYRTLNRSMSSPVTIKQLSSLHSSLLHKFSNNGNLFKWKRLTNSKLNFNLNFILYYMINCIFHNKW